MAKGIASSAQVLTSIESRSDRQPVATRSLGRMHSYSSSRSGHALLEATFNLAAATGSTREGIIRVGLVVYAH